MLPLEKRILRSTLELVDSFLALKGFCTEHVTLAGAVLLSVLSSVTSSHLTGMIFEGSCAKGAGENVDHNTYLDQHTKKERKTYYENRNTRF
jgi:hypothetical protein